MLFKILLLSGSNVLLQTDHAALRWLWESKNVFGQCARSFELMAEFDCKLVHRSESVHGNAEALSRCPAGRRIFLMIVRLAMIMA